MVNIDDAAILKHAKELCALSGIAWDCLSANASGIRVLSDRDRRECLMRARQELISSADDADALQTPEPSAETPESPTGNKREELQSSLIASASSEPIRRVA